MDLQLTGKTVLVAGGSTGIGRAVAEAFAGEHANVAVIGRNPQRLAATEAALQAAGVKNLVIAADLSARDECRRAVAEVVGTFGGVDVLVANAASTAYASIDSPDEAMFARIEGKVKPMIWCVQEASRAMREQGGGAIICIGGVSARQTYNAIAEWAAIPSGQNSLPAGMGNAAVVNFAKHASDELGRSNITVNVVHPGLMRTDRFPERLERFAQHHDVDTATAEKMMSANAALGRVVEPEEVADLVVFLASARARAITGEAIAVDAGSLRSIFY